MVMSITFVLKMILKSFSNICLNLFKILRGQNVSNKPDPAAGFYRKVGDKAITLSFKHS